MVVSHQDTNEEDEETTIDWTGGFSDAFTTTQPTSNLHRTQSHNSSDDEQDNKSKEEDDPFGDFNSSSEITEKWEEGFTSNFADMDVKSMDETNLKKETPTPA